MFFSKSCSSSVSVEKMKENFQMGKVSEKQRNQQWQKTSKAKEFVTKSHELYHAVTLKHNSITELIIIV